MLSQFSFRDPRTVARDIPGLLDVLFPRLSGGLVRSLNVNNFKFSGIEPIDEELLKKSQLQKAMLFELAVIKAEHLLEGNLAPNWDQYLQVATLRQRKHFDAEIPTSINNYDIKIAEHAALNLFVMLNKISAQNNKSKLQISPTIPGFRWISSGNADYSINDILIEVKYTDRNFISNDFRQVLIYWLLKYSSCIENGSEPWKRFMLINPRKNYSILIDFDFLIQSASSNLNRLEVYELFRSVVGYDKDKI